MHRLKIQQPNRTSHIINDNIAFEQNFCNNRNVKNFIYLYFFFVILRHIYCTRKTLTINLLASQISNSVETQLLRALIWPIWIEEHVNFFITLLVTKEVTLTLLLNRVPWVHQQHSFDMFNLYYKFNELLYVVIRCVPINNRR